MFLNLTLNISVWTFSKRLFPGLNVILNPRFILLDTVHVISHPTSQVWILLSICVTDNSLVFRFLEMLLAAWYSFLVISFSALLMCTWAQYYRYRHKNIGLCNNTASFAWHLLSVNVLSDVSNVFIDLLSLFFSLL